jgi:hypothetical protein
MKSLHDQIRDLCLDDDCVPICLAIIESAKEEHMGPAENGEHSEVDWESFEVCPICGGKLHLQYGGYNGHLWGKCETEECLLWLE